MSPRDDFLRASAAEFDERGYAGTTFATIAARLGRSRSYVQHFARTKAELAAEIAWYPFRHGGFMMEPELITGGRRMLMQIIRAAGDKYSTDVMARASVRLMAERDQIDGADLPVPFEAWILPIGVLLQETIEDGQLDPAADIEVLTLRVIAAFAGMKALCEHRGELGRLAERAVPLVEDILEAHAPR